MAEPGSPTDLAWLDSLFRPPASITVLVGPSGSGKTVLCQRAARVARAAGRDVRGVISPRRYDGAGVRVGIDLLDPATGQRWELAERTAPDPLTGRSWRFVPEALARGAALLAGSGPCDLLIVDELGPLELLEGQGWANALDILRAGAYRRALVVVRPGLLPVLLERLEPLPLHTLWLPGPGQGQAP